MGTSKRYADSIDRRVDERRTEVAAAASAQPRGTSDHPTQRPLRDWAPPWPPIRISEVEWIIMRDSKREPAGVIRMMVLGPRRETFYRVVTWAPTSDGRELVGYYPSLDHADRSLLFSPANPKSPQPPFGAQRPG